MSWSLLAAQFCHELAFGVLVALAFVPPAPVGRFFYRLMGTSALLATAVGVGLPWRSGEVGFADLAFWGAVGVGLGFPAFGVRGASRPGYWAGLALGLLGSGLATASLALGSVETHGLLQALVVVLTPLTSGTVAGSVGLAMVLGHWYLTVPNLEIRHLARLVRVAVGAILACMGCLIASAWLFRGLLEAAERPLFGPTGLFYFGTRMVVGLVFPLAFAWMAAGALRFQNTRSATGILYASTVLVLIGAAVSVSLQDTYGVPL